MVDEIDPTGQHREKIQAGLESLLEVERLVQLLGGTPWALDATPENVRTFCFALVHEVGEIADELQWKPWKLKGSVDSVAIAYEAADVLAFLALVFRYCRAHGVTMDHIATAFIDKSRTNVERLNGRVAGYGVSEGAPR